MLCKISKPFQDSTLRGIALQRVFSVTLALNLTGLADLRPINPVLVEIEFSTKTSWATWNVFYGQSDWMTAVAGMSLALQLSYRSGQM